MHTFTPKGVTLNLYPARFSDRVAAAAPAVAFPTGDEAALSGNLIPNLWFSVVFPTGFDEYLAIGVVVVAFEVVYVTRPDAGMEWVSPDVIKTVSRASS